VSILDQDHLRDQNPEAVNQSKLRDAGPVLWSRAQKLSLSSLSSLSLSPPRQSRARENGRAGEGRASPTDRQKAPDCSRVFLFSAAPFLPFFESCRCLAHTILFVKGLKFFVSPFFLLTSTHLSSLFFACASPLCATFFFLPRGREGGETPQVSARLMAGPYRPGQPPVADTHYSTVPNRQMVSAAQFATGRGSVRGPPAARRPGGFAGGTMGPGRPAASPGQQPGAPAPVNAMAPVGAYATAPSARMQPASTLGRPGGMAPPAGQYATAPTARMQPASTLPRPEMAPPAGNYASAPSGRMGMQPASTLRPGMLPAGGGNNYAKAPARMGMQPASTLRPGMLPAGGGNEYAKSPTGRMGMQPASTLRPGMLSAGGGDNYAKSPTARMGMQPASTLRPGMLPAGAGGTLQGPAPGVPPMRAARSGPPPSVPPVRAPGGTLRGPLPAGFSGSGGMPAPGTAPQPQRAPVAAPAVQPQPQQPPVGAPAADSTYQLTSAAAGTGRGPPDDSQLTEEEVSEQAELMQFQVDGLRRTLAMIVKEGEGALFFVVVFFGMCAGFLGVWSRSTAYLLTLSQLSGPTLRRCKPPLTNFRQITEL
jgi:hypothetical protein